jgi:hypothetical protein
MFALVILFCASGSGHGFVLCRGPASHTHIEVTFNGVDCGHALISPVTAKHPQYRTRPAPLSTASCYCCTDLPLSCPRGAASHNSYSAGVRNGKTAVSMTTLPTASFLLVPQTSHQDGQRMVSMIGHAGFSRILSSSLRI